MQPVRKSPDSVQLQPETYENIGDLLDVLRRRWKFSLASVGVCLLLGLAAWLLLTPKYTSTVTLEINRDNPTANVSSANPGTVPDDVKTEVETDTNILQSDALALQVIEAQKLGAAKPFSKIKVPAEDGLPLSKAPRRREKYLRAFSKALKVQSVPDSRLITVAFTSPDPQIAANTANALADSFIADTLDRRLHSTSDVSFWISKELDSLRNRVQASEQALAEFEHKTGIAGIDVGSSAPQGNGLAIEAHNPILDRLNTLNQELTTAEANRISSETVYRLVSSQDPEMVLGLGSMSMINGQSLLAQSGSLDLLRSLRLQEISLSTQAADLSTRFGSQNPRLVQVNSQLAEINSQIQSEMNKLKRRAENAFSYAKQNENAVRTELGRQQVLADRFTDNTVQLQLLAQEAYSNRTLYQSLSTELNQANVTAGIHATRIDIVDRALVAGTPTSPNMLLLIPGFLAVGLLVGIVGSFLRESVDDSITLPRDVESTVEFPVIARLPIINDVTGTALLASDGTSLLTAPQSNVSQAFRFLCTLVVHRMVDISHPVVLVSSPQRGDGKSTVAYNLAVALAQRGGRVLLIDADMRDPSQQRFFGAGQADVGLSDLLRNGHVSMHDALVPHGTLSNLYLLSAGKTPELPAELLSSAHFDQLLQDAKANFSWVIIDSAPLLSFTDAAIIAGKTDGVLPVLASGVTSKEALTSCTALLLQGGARILGFVLNQERGRSQLPLPSSYYRFTQEVSEHA